jgi:hypothetical protein
MIEKAAKEVPYVFSVPETYEELTGDKFVLHRYIGYRRKKRA